MKAGKMIRRKRRSYHHLPECDLRALRARNMELWACALKTAFCNNHAIIIQ